MDATITGYHTEKALLQRLAGIPGYRQAVSTAFGPETEFNLDVLAKAVACYERTLTAPDSPFDHYIKGDQSTLSETAKRGMEEFQEVGCVACHFGVNFAGPAPGPALKMGDPFFELFPNRVGTKYDKKYHLLSDLGLYEVDKNPEHKRMWRVPPLRNIAVTAPYFHNGSAKTLREAVKIMGKTQENMDLSDSQIDDIVAFLNSLTGKFPLQSVPHLPPTVDDTVFPVKLR